jgi:Domain of unknown function (DUF4394)
MRNSSIRRGIRATALAFLVLAATLAGAGCGKDGGSGPTDPLPSDPGPSDPGPGSWPGPAPVGDVMYAVDLANNFLVFGSGSLNVLAAKMRISGLPILKRIIGIAIRPSNGKLYGVGNDSRVYIIDPLTAVATPVSSDRFSPKIVDFFDIHFAMDLEPKTERARLIAVESGANWSISLDDGTATAGEEAHYGTGTELEGRTPRLLGLVYAPPPEGSVGVCENLAYGIDADEAIMIASCDPATGKWWPTGTGEPPQASITRRPAGKLSQTSLASSPTALEDLKDQLLRCGEVMPSPGGGPGNPEEPPPQEGGPWFPRTPDTEFYVWLVKLGTHQNRVGIVKLINTESRMPGVTWHEELPPSEEPYQTVEWVPHKSVPSKLQHQLRQEVQLSVARSWEPEPSTPPAPPSDPRAQCR